MNLIDRVIDGYLKRKGLNPTPGAQQTLPFPINNLSVVNWTDKSYVDAYQNNVDLYAVAGFLIRKAASIPWFVYKKKSEPKAKASLERYKQLTRGIGNKGAYEQALIARKGAYDENEVVEDSELARLLRKPNPGQGQDKFFESAIGYYVISGESNLWGNDGGIPEGKFVELQVLPTQFMEDYYDPNDLYGILGHRLMVGGGVNIPKENVLRWKNWRPEFDESTRIHMRGISPVQAAWKTYQMGDNAGQSMANMLKNGGSKGALSPLAANGQPTPLLTREQADAAAQMVNSRFNGNANAGNIGVLARPYDYLNFGLSAVDMDVIKVMDLTLHQWCRVLGLPVVLFDSAHTSDNNYQNAMRDLVTNTIVPMLASFRDQLNMWLLPRMKATNEFIDFDITALPELQRDMEKLVNSLKAAYWLTEDEKRVAMNYDEKGGIYASSLVPTGMVPIEMIGQDLGVSPDMADQEEPDVEY